LSAHKKLQKYIYLRVQINILSKQLEDKLPKTITEFIMYTLAQIMYELE